jgi:MoaA/NifB/PqqE/SkfB family radical SAM enzyme
MLITYEHFKKIYKDKIPATFLVIMLDMNCNANCKVCIAKHVFKGPLCKQYCEKFLECKHLRCCDHIASDDEFYANLQKILDVINTSNLSIMISGGEPTLSPRFEKVFQILNAYKSKISDIRIETNGAGLDDLIIQNLLINNNVKILLSRYSYLEAHNLREFNFKYKPVLNSDIVKYAKIYGKNLIINSILLKKIIPNAQALLKEVREMQKLGITQHTFVEIMVDTTLEAANQDLVKYYNEQLITAQDLHKQLLAEGVQVVSGFGTDTAGEFYYKKDNLKFSINYCKIDKKYQEVPNKFFRKFLVVPSGEISIDGIEV